MIITPEELQELVDIWRQRVRQAIPAEYADRGLHAKYLRMDNHAAGLDDAADDLDEFLTAHQEKG